MFHEILGVIVVILIPLVLLALLFLYLRRMAPGGTVLASEAAAPEPVQPAPIVDGPGARVTGARKCNNCGMVTTAAKIGGLLPRCQNCNAALT